MFPVRFKQLLSATALLALAGCGSQNTPSMQAMQPTSHYVAPAPAQISTGGDIALAPTNIGIRLNGESPKMNRHYGRVLGYFNGKTSTISEVVKLTAATNVIFNNVDALSPHTASFLGNATKQMAPWPANFDGSSTQSPAGTVISTTSFSTGALSAGTKSLKYNSGSPGFFMFGCFFHYNLDGMRTVIIVI
jgi:hypothetical protein